MSAITSDLNPKQVHALDLRKRTLPEIMAELEPLAKQIALDLATADKEVALSVEHSNVAVFSAWSAGKGLLEAKARLPHGKFSLWSKERFVKHQTTLGDYIRLAQQFEHAPTFTSIRKALAAIGEGRNNDGSVAISKQSTPAPPSGFFQIVAKWKHWMTDVEEKNIKYDAEEVKQQYRPMYEWLKELYGE